MLRQAGQYRFGILLAALLLMLIYAPVLDLFFPRIHPAVARCIVGGVFVLLTIAAVNAVSTKRRTPLIALLLAALALLAELTDVSMLRRDTQLIGHVLCVLFLGYVIVVLLRHVFLSRRVHTNIVFASLCVYLLLGILWTFVYSMVEMAKPDSFTYPPGVTDEMRFGAAGTSLAFYFSFVTMTTLGYGDIVPTTTTSRALVTLQAVMGQFYMAVLMAWLVGLHIAHSRPEKREERREKREESRE